MYFSIVLDRQCTNVGRVRELLENGLRIQIGGFDHVRHAFVDCYRADPLSTNSILLRMWIGPCRLEIE